MFLCNNHNNDNSIKNDNDHNANDNNNKSNVMYMQHVSTYISTYCIHMYIYYTYMYTS